MSEFEAFKAKHKFDEDISGFYSGVSNQDLKQILTEKINLSADDFAQVYNLKTPNNEQYQKK